MSPRQSSKPLPAKTSKSCSRRQAGRCRTATPPTCSHAGIAIREFPLEGGFADYLLYVDRQVIGAIEAKKEGTTLTGVEPQAARYSTGLPEYLPAWRRPLPFLYESTGVETFFTNGLEPDACSPPNIRLPQAGDFARLGGSGRRAGVA